MAALSSFSISGGTGMVTGAAAGATHCKSLVLTSLWASPIKLLPPCKPR